MKHSKIWGTTSSIFENPFFEVHRIEINKGGYCSKHCHKFKHNLFYVETGKLKITIYHDEDKINDETILISGDQTTVIPNKFHRFEALENTLAYEIYYIFLPPEDIIREDNGGINC